MTYYITEPKYLAWMLSELQGLSVEIRCSSPRVIEQALDILEDEGKFSKWTVFPRAHPNKYLLYRFEPKPYEPPARASERGV